MDELLLPLPPHVRLLRDNQALRPELHSVAHNVWRRVFPTPDVSDTLPLAEVAKRLMYNLPSPCLEFNIQTDSVKAQLFFYTGYDSNDNAIGDMGVTFNKTGEEDQLGNLVLGQEWQGVSLGKQALDNVVSVSRLRGAKGLGLSATGVGSYAWQNYGFILSEDTLDYCRKL